MLNQLFESQIFNVGNWHFTIGKLFGLLLIILFMYLAWKVTKAVWRIKFYTKNSIEVPQRKKLESYLRQLILLFGIFFSVRLLDLDPAFYNNESIVLRFSLFILAIIVLLGANLLNWFLTNVLTRSYKGTGEEMLDVATGTVRYIVITMAGILILRNFNLDYSLYHHQTENTQVDFRITKILIVALIFLCARLLTWIITNVALYGVYRKREIDEGSQFAVNQLLKYVIYLFAIFFSLNSLGINMTLLLGGAAALLVGIGLGLQQTFNDFFSGLVLLFERSVAVGDILTVGEVQGTVKKIGMRSSIIETLGNRNIIIPNSKLVNENVLNWNHFDNTVRFEIVIGVAYGSDTEIVKRLLLKSIEKQPDVLTYPKPFVRFNNFGDNALEMTLYFFSDNLVFQENVKSDIRFEIDKLFRENNISIPFPQREVWIRKSEL